ncbi:hypothetical protein FTO60_09345 [Octadecabacter sp. SW4]|uniref:GTA head formation protein, RCAP_rcc01685 family n=1 Tax=Octadecabacter sp. SW4 TaxID=2602067 RepID=UPI0011C1F8E8|nr:hypothetical protein [Octadecabacter sp. SW4]QEE35893.1 hypothetical protein FTO60_09345 [Octadecabacter sp. SW4]|tara:strand:+ start:158 stop:391 length:234 start_codon:yes stop_codon:yes gene_type:complete
MVHEPRRYGLESFACAPGMRIEALEQLNTVQLAQVQNQVDRIEAQLERIERRTWIAVFGVVVMVVIAVARALADTPV